MIEGRSKGGEREREGEEGGERKGEGGVRREKETRCEPKSDTVRSTTVISTGFRLACSAVSAWLVLSCPFPSLPSFFIRCQERYVAWECAAEQAVMGSLDASLDVDSLKGDGKLSASVRLEAVSCLSHVARRPQA